MDTPPVSTKECVFTTEEIQSIVSKVQTTPFHLYNGDMIVENAKEMLHSFKEHFPTYTNYFAVKATPNPHIIKLLKQIGMGVDCSSMAELLLSEKIGFRGNEIMFTSNNTPAHEYQKAFELGAIINLDDLTQIDYLRESLGGQMPELISLRYNPGPLKKGNAIIGEPQESKFGLTRDQLELGYSKLREYGVKKFGLHCMVASNELQISYFEETAKLLFSTVSEITQKLGIEFDLVNLGGGVGIPYRPDQSRIVFTELANLINGQYNIYFNNNNSNNNCNALNGNNSNVNSSISNSRIRVVTECGRVITGPYGCLITRAIHTKSTYKQYIGVDACMANLMRPGMYGAYHHVSVINIHNNDNQTKPNQQEQQQHQFKYDIVGSLCENNDKFAVNREINKEIKVGDIIIVHDTGAHGHSMGFNYNGKLRSAEYLYHKGELKCIRRAETYQDLFATLDFSSL